MSLRRVFSRSALNRLVFTIKQEGVGTAFRRGVSFIRRPANAATPQDASYLDSFWQDIARKDAFHVSAAPALLTGRRRIAMVGDLYLPQCRKYRVAQLSELWGGLGVDCNISHYADVPRAVSLMQNATHLMFYRTQNTPQTAMYLYEARRLRLPVLYDLDDPLFSVSAYETYENMKALPPSMKAHFLSEAPKYLSAMNQADIITVSTPAMVEHTLAYTARPVHFRRNFADAETISASEAALSKAGRQAGAPFRVGFASGSMGHEIDFALIAEDIIGFLDAAPDRQLVIMGYFDETLLPEGLRDRVESHKFSSYEAYLETLSTVDCAVMPLTDDAFNRCKSGVRVIDAAAVAVPSIVGTVSDMAQMVTDQKTGFVIPQGGSWHEALETLAQDRALVSEMGQAARRSLLDTWTARATLPVVEQAVIDWVQKG